MMSAAMEVGVDWYLYTSSVGVYGEAEVFKEDDVWKKFPSKMIGMVGGLKEWVRFKQKLMLFRMVNQMYP